MRTEHPWETIIVATTRLSYGPRRTCADHRLRGGRPRSRTLISPYQQDQRLGDSVYKLHPLGRPTIWLPRKRQSTAIGSTT